MINRKKAEEIYKKSIDVLNSVQLKNGGCLATPKGMRYPYVYPRDHAVVILGFLSAGLYSQAKKALRFILECQRDTGAFPQRVDSEGRDASYKPVQIDNTGLTLFALSEYVNKTKDTAFAKRYWSKVRMAVHYILGNMFGEGNLVFTPNSIHEFPPTEKGLEIWANSVCCSALRRMYNLGVKLNQVNEDWKDEADRLKKSILKYMWNSRKKTFVKTIRIKESSSVIVDPDASKYAIADFGVLDDKNSKVKRTVANIEKELWNKELGGICRYPKYEGRNNGGWGPWPHFTLMIARHFIRTGNRQKADKYLSWVIDNSYNNLLPEHISTKSEFEEYVNDYSEAGILRKDRQIMIENTRKHPLFKSKGIAYISIPLAWPHAEFIRTWNMYKKRFKIKI